MKNVLHLLFLFCFLLTTSCAQRLSSTQDLTTEERTAAYRVLKDVSYGPDAEQNMDIYLSERSRKYGKRNFTIVFLHGGAYYLSDKSQEEKYIKPYLAKGLNVVNLNYRLKRGIPIATSDLTHALNFLRDNNHGYNLHLNNIIVTGFSAGAQIAANVALGQNNPSFPDRLNDEMEIKGIINISGPVDQLDVIEKIFINYDHDLFRKAGEALFAAEGYAPEKVIAMYEPITYFDAGDPPVFLWHGGEDNQIPPETFAAFVKLFREKVDYVRFVPEGRHSPTEEELKAAYTDIFSFLDSL